MSVRSVLASRGDPSLGTVMAAAVLSGLPFDPSDEIAFAVLDACEVADRLSDSVAYPAAVASILAYHDSRVAGADWTLSEFVDTLTADLEHTRQQDAFVSRVCEQPSPFVPVQPASVPPTGVAEATAAAVDMLQQQNPVIGIDRASGDDRSATMLFDNGSKLVVAADVTDQIRAVEAIPAQPAAGGTPKIGPRVAYTLGDQKILGVVTSTTETHADFVADNGNVYRQVAHRYLETISSDTPIAIRVTLAQQEATAARKILEDAVNIADRKPYEVLVDLCYKELVDASGRPLIVIADVINGGESSTPYVLFRLENDQQNTLAESLSVRELAWTKELSYQGLVYSLELIVPEVSATVKKPSRSRKKAT